MERFDVARGTVRRALKALVDEGLLVQVRGSGTYVAEPGISHPAGVRPLSFADSLAEQGMDFETHVIDKWTAPASFEVAMEPVWRWARRSCSCVAFARSMEQNPLCVRRAG